MPETKKQTVKKGQTLNLDKMEQIVAEVLGVHPKYLIKRGIKLELDIYKMEADGLTFDGWKHKEHHER